MLSAWLPLMVQLGRLRIKKYSKTSIFHVSHESNSICISKLPFHSTAKLLPLPTDLCHKTPSKCEQPWALSHQGKTFQQATHMPPTSTSELLHYHEQTTK